MLNFLLHNYLHSHVALPTKISFLSANPNLSTFFLKFESDRANRKTYNDIKAKVRSYLEQNNIEHSYEFVGENGMSYLIDANSVHELAI